MALGGIGEGSALDRFQQVRDLAKKKLDAASSPFGDDPRARAAELLRKKQAELGQGVAPDRPQAAMGAAAPRQAGAPAAKMEFPRSGSIPAGTGGMAAYGRAGGTERPDPKPSLGRYIDLTA